MKEWHGITYERMETYERTNAWVEAWKWNATNARMERMHEGMDEWMNWIESNAAINPRIMHMEWTSKRMKDGMEWDEQTKKGFGGPKRCGLHSDFKTMGRRLRSLKSYPDPIIIPSPRKWLWDFAWKFESLLGFYFFVLDFMLKWQVGLASGLNIPKMNPPKWHVRSASGLNIPQPLQKEF